MKVKSFFEAYIRDKVRFKNSYCHIGKVVSPSAFTPSLVSRAAEKYKIEVVH
jgi:hypothetical protein